MNADDISVFTHCVCVRVGGGAFVRARLSPSHTGRLCVPSTKTHSAAFEGAAVETVLHTFRPFSEISEPDKWLGVKELFLRLILR